MYLYFIEIQYSWGKNHSLLFIDNPVGTGFSFTDDDRGYATNQTTVSILFVHKIFLAFLKVLNESAKLSKLKIEHTYIITVIFF